MSIPSVCVVGFLDEFDRYCERACRYFLEFEDFFIFFFFKGLYFLRWCDFYVFFFFFQEDTERFDGGVSLGCRTVHCGCALHDILIWNGTRQFRLPRLLLV